MINVSGLIKGDSFFLSIMPQSQHSADSASLGGETEPVTSVSASTFVEMLQEVVRSVGKSSRVD